MINRFELQAMRKLLMIDVREAAEEIGQVSVRSWQYWESGERTIPYDVDKKMRELIKNRQDIIDMSIKKKWTNSKWYSTFAQYFEEHPQYSRIDWRIQQSVLSFLICNYHIERLV